MSPDCTPHWRPRLHFTPRDTWMNDPNGLIHHDGVWHLFFQNNPHGRHWGNMSWGHATSTDLVHWDEQPVAIWHGEHEGIFSGSVVHDAENTAGLVDATPGPLVAYYTSDFTEGGERPRGQAQSLAWSTDGGQTWTKHPGNPLLDRGTTDFRDPKVFWHAPTRRWAMVAVEAPDRQVLIHTSPDLLHWTHTSTFGPAGSTEGIWECPDLVEVPVEGGETTRWVLIVSHNPGGPNGGSGMQWFLGDFDGETFTCADDSSRIRWFDHGTDLYAAVSFAGVTGAPRMLGWLSNWSYAAQVPTRPWTSAMSVVREVTLAPTGDGDLTLRHRPVLEGAQPTEGTDAAHLLRTTVPAERDQPVVIELCREGEASTTLVFRFAADQLVIDRTNASVTGVHAGFETITVPLPAGPVEVEIIEDHGLVEVFLAGGLVQATVQTFGADAPLQVRASGCEVSVVKLG